MASRNEFDDFFGDDDDTPVIDTRADGRLYRVPIGRVAPNLVNPRRDFGTEDELIDLGKSLARRQIQACPVVSRNAYLKLWPDHARHVGDIDYVLVSGERRYRAANAVGLPALECVVNDDLAADRKTFLEAVVAENVDRQNFDPIEEAYAVQSLVREFGSNRAVAQHFDRVDGWVTQRVLLINLHPTMQDLVRKKTIPLEAARKLGKLARDNTWDAGQQAAWWEQEQERRAAVAQARIAARKAAEHQPTPTPRPSQAAVTPAPPEPKSFTAVKPDPPAASPTTTDAPAPEPDEDQTRTQPKLPVIPAVPEPPARLPEARTDSAAHSTPTRVLPYDNGFTVAQHLILKMPPQALEEAIRILNRHAAENGMDVQPETSS